LHRCAQLTADICGIKAENVLIYWNQTAAMLKKERQAHILRQVNLHNRVLSADLCQEMDVSEDTIRRDLVELSDLGQIIKVHGGALSVSFHTSLQPTRVYLQDKKKVVAEKAVRMIREGMFVLTTGGTTIIEMAKMLPPDLKATFITGSLHAAMEYIQHPHIDVILIGDRLSRNSRITVGGEAIEKIKEIKADICFLGINAIDAELGISDNDWDVVQVKKAMISSSSKVVAVTVADKINTVQKLKVCDIDKIDVLVTDVHPENPLLEVYHRKGLQVL
jgi:DeoR/GlpR family transcriptional regulator of sugar metabolism